MGIITTIKLQFKYNVIAAITTVMPLLPHSILTILIILTADIDKMNTSM